ncbi:TetR/AcrR family transcriptional regulator C-terminal domain-containing protein [Microbacterium sp. RD1]|uniref:TetR/AcrR family transcriptional regulator C-terminal domain-containing protein n=1 Tax=Microbacterium sp. RD1 TaxID=3457313 RepID=UPI003FA5A6C5
MTRYSRNDIVTAAVALLDKVGLPDLTMRRLALSLEIQPSALYWHVADKQTLLGAVADRILDRVAPVAEGLAWPEAVTAHMHALRDALLTYRDAAEVVASSLALGQGGAGAVTTLEEAVAAGGFPRTTSRAGASALMHFVLGSVWHEQQRAFADSVGATAPEVAASPADVTLARKSAATDFAFGVDLLVSGFLARRDADAAGVDGASTT